MLVCCCRRQINSKHNYIHISVQAARSTSDQNRHRRYHSSGRHVSSHAGLILWGGRFWRRQGLRWLRSGWWTPAGGWFWRFHAAASKAGFSPHIPLIFPKDFLRINSMHCLFCRSGLAGSSVADPDPVLCWPQDLGSGSGMEKSRSGIRFEHSGSYFWEIRIIFFWLKII